MSSLDTVYTIRDIYFVVLYPIRFMLHGMLNSMSVVFHMLKLSLIHPQLPLLNPLFHVFLLLFHVFWFFLPLVSLILLSIFFLLVLHLLTFLICCLPLMLILAVAPSLNLLCPSSLLLLYPLQVLLLFPSLLINTPWSLDLRMAFTNPNFILFFGITTQVYQRSFGHSTIVCCYEGRGCSSTQ